MNGLDRYGSDHQTFFGLWEITARTNTFDQYFQTLDDDGSLNKVTISCNIDRKISGFVEEVASLGTIQIRTDDECYGITHKEGSLFCCVEGKGIQRVNIRNKKSTMIVSCDLSSWSYIVSSDNKLYYTNSKESTVTCCDIGGNIIWTFKDENSVKEPRGIAIDNVGNVYTVCYNQKKLIVLSADGQLSRQLLSKDDGLVYPYAVAYDKIQNRICVINLQNNGFLFDVTF
ncbi:TRIM71 [Mytilus coruscus]|uniref:TRIM71 n=1 Tax=Mytilus coruscus TaxID=42192 RepID=A0A6J8BB49_MYTCO|nr:TRIM71 [Mytilus coruscus]